MRRRGFTLIELLAVVAIFALLAGIAIPNLGIRTARRLDDETKRLASTLEFARQRAVMTGAPHRVVVDVDGGAYWLEWLAVDPAESEAAAAAFGPAVDPRAPVEMAPPAGALRSFQRVVGTFGERVELPEELSLAAVQTPSGRFEGGDVEIRFDRDGTSDPTVVELETEDGDVVFLELAPLADTVRVGRDGG